MAAVKLIYLSGYVTCSVQISHWSFWGCGDHPSEKNHVSLPITTSTNALLMPPSQFFAHAGGAGRWSQLPGYNSFSPEIILPRFSPYSVSSGQELRLWFGDDLVNFTESDNAGLVCCNVYVLYQQLCYKFQVSGKLKLFLFFFHFLVTNIKGSINQSCQIKHTRYCFT